MTTPATPGLFITGTDTGVGKTAVGVALARLARRRGRRPVPFKPCETGCAPEPLDARALWRAAGEPAPLSAICPYPLKLPAAPAQAAAAEGVRLDLDDLTSRFALLRQAGDFMLVEGAGGLLVPYVGGETAVDLARRFALPLVVVARVALGTVNHTSLTLREAARHGLLIAGVVLNQTTPAREPHEDGNADLIAAVTGIRALGTLPFLPPARREDPDALADALAGALGEDGLRRLGL